MLRDITLLRQGAMDTTEVAEMLSSEGCQKTGMA